MTIDSEREQPLIAVIGGVRGLEPEEAAAACDAARQFGEAFGRADISILVYDSNPESLEPHLVAGFCSTAPADGEGRIVVRYAQTQENAVRFVEEDGRPALFDRQPVGNDEWEAGFFRSFSAEDGADGMFLLGGGTSTFAAGHIGVARGVPVAAVTRFGGAAAKIWSEIARRADDGDAPSWSADQADRLAEWMEARCADRDAKRAEVRRFRSEMARRGKERGFVAAAAVVGAALCALITYGLRGADAPVDVLLALIGVALFGGTSGALVRSVLWAKDRADRGPAAAAVIGGFAGLIVGLAYIVPILQSAPGLFRPAEVGAAVDLWPLRFNMLSTAAVAFGAGVGFDAIFNRMREVAPDLPVGKPEQNRSQIGR